MHREQWLGRASLLPHEQPREQCARQSTGEEEWRCPRVEVAARRRDKRQQRHGCDDEDRARIVDGAGDGGACGAEPVTDAEEREPAQRRVDEEDPPPRQIVDEETTDERTAHPRDHPHGRRDPRHPASLARRHDVGEHRLCLSRYPTPGRALQPPGDDELGARGDETAQHRRQHEQHDRNLERALAAVDVAELAVKRHRRNQRDLERDEHPGDIAADVLVHGLRRGREDEQVERGQRHRQHEAHDDDVQVRLVCAGLTPR
ncbi:unannotated protein [freshwater metagenome]|uniref:Unannotated protein n=1 Tax=freshwater metagenome TaxID=449393 RepID=A0A6J7P375_9ZZZZ